MNATVERQQNIELSKFPLKLRENIKSLINFRLGLSSCTLNVKPNLHSNIVYVEIPFAGKYLQWELIFIPDSYDIAPDLSFMNSDFLLDSEIDMLYKEVPAWENWNLDNPNSLCKLIANFYCLFKKYQLSKLEDNKFLMHYVSYKTLIEDKRLPKNDIEVFIERNDNLHFKIRLKVTFSKLPPFEQEQYFNNGLVENPDTDSILITISYLTNNRASSTIQLSPRLRQIFENNHVQLQVPTFSKQHDVSEYVNEIQYYFQGKLDQIQENFKARKEFINIMLAYQGASIIEYDNTNFTKIFLLLQSGDAYALTSIKLDENFPASKPSVQFRSISHGLPNEVFSEVLHYEYVQNWSVEKMVKTILQNIKHHLPEFKANCIKELHNN